MIVDLSAAELLLLRQRLCDGPGTPAVDSALDARLYRAQQAASPPPRQWSPPCEFYGYHGYHHSACCEIGQQQRKERAKPPELGRCTWQPPEGTDPVLSETCKLCGHAVIAHIGAEKCVVCVLVDQSTPAWRRQQARIYGSVWR